MEEVIRAIKNLNSVIFLTMLLLSCSTGRLNDNEKKTMSISFGSVYENEKLTLSINDSVYYADRDINTNSLGTDPENYIEVVADKVHLKGTFTAKIDPDFDMNYIRELSIDTVLYRKKGRNIIIGANYDIYYVSQQNTRFKVE